MSALESFMTNIPELGTVATHKLLLLDARSYAAAIANRAKGGGCEYPGRSPQLSSSSQTQLHQCVVDSASPLTINMFVLCAKIKTTTTLCLLIRFYHCLHPVPEYYPNCEMVFMSMANIHYIRKSFHSLRSLCTQMPDPVK